MLDLLDPRSIRLPLLATPGVPRQRTAPVMTVLLLAELLHEDGRLSDPIAQELAGATENAWTGTDLLHRFVRGASRASLPSPSPSFGVNGGDSLAAAIALAC